MDKYGPKKLFPVGLFFLLILVSSAILLLVSSAILLLAKIKIIMIIYEVICESWAHAFQKTTRNIGGGLNDQNCEPCLKEPTL